MTNRGVDIADPRARALVTPRLNGPAGQAARAKAPGAFAALLSQAVRSGDRDTLAAALGGTRGERFQMANASRAARQPSAARGGAMPANVPGQYGDLIANAARRHGVEPALVAAVIEVESSFNPRAGSPAGAKGLMQLMDATARGLGVADSFDPEQNVMGGTKFLRQLLDKYGGDTRLALAAYNAGPGAVDRHGGIPPFAETQRYVPKVLAALERYRAGAPPATPVRIPPDARRTTG